jgi:TIR domain
MASHVAVAESNKEAKAKVFISYSRKDLAFADRLEAALKVRGLEPLIDRTEIYAFEEWWKRIEALIARADKHVEHALDAFSGACVDARDSAFRDRRGGDTAV